MFLKRGYSYILDVPSNESQFSSSNTTLFGFEMQGPSVSSSQFGQTSVNLPTNHSIDVVGNSIPQLPAWAKDSMALPNPSPELYGKQNNICQ